MKYISWKTVCMLHVLVRVQIKHLNKYSRFLLKMPNCGAAAVLLIQVHHKIKNYLRWRNQKYYWKMWKIPAEECYFLKSCSFTIIKTPSQVFFTACNNISNSSWPYTLQLQNWQKLFAFYWQVRSSSPLLSINKVYSWFSEGTEFLITHNYKIVSLIALLFLIGYGSSRCTVCSQHSGII